MTFYYPWHRRLPSIDKKSSIVSLLFLPLLAFSSSIVLAQTQETEVSKGWAVSGSNVELKVSQQTAQLSDQDSAEVDGALENVESAVAADAKPSAEQVEAVQQELEVAEQEPEGPAIEGPTIVPSDTLLEVAPKPEIAARPRLDIDDSLRAQLESQFQALQDLRDTEDAFSERLGETFFSYGDALQRAGRLEEAQDMFAQALHINKINNGVNNIAQRPMLKSLAWLELAEGDIEKAEEYVSRIIWVEKQQREVRDTFSYDIILALANKKLDQYLYRPVAGEASIAVLDSATKYFRYIIRRYGDQPIDKLLMPYGEIAYVQHLKFQLAPRVSSSFASQSQNRINSQRFPERDRRFGGDRRFGQPTPPRPIFIAPQGGNGESYMREYFSKAARADDTKHKVQALLNQGDVHQMFGRSAVAAAFYERAWVEAQNLAADHELVVGMSKPHKLPAFFFASDRNNEEIATYTPRTNVPLDISVDAAGRVSKVFTEPAETDSPKLTSRARRSVKRITFRPAIEAGKLVGTDRYTENIRVIVRKSDDVATDSSGN